MLEIRASFAPIAEGRTLSGYAAVFNRPSRPLNDARGRPFTEFVNRGAFAESLRSGDVWALWNHDAGEVLARHPDTMTLAEDDIGLRFSFELPDTSRGNDVRSLMQAGTLLGQMSFGFRVRQDKWDTRGDERVRNLLDVELVEISVVPEGAYPATNSQLRHGGRLALAKRRLALLRSVR